MVRLPGSGVLLFMSLQGVWSWLSCACPFGEGARPGPWLISTMVRSCRGIVWFCSRSWFCSMSLWRGASCHPPNCNPGMWKSLATCPGTWNRRACARSKGQRTGWHAGIPPGLLPAGGFPWRAGPLPAATERDGGGCRVDGGEGWFYRCGRAGLGLWFWVPNGGLKWDPLFRARGGSTCAGSIRSTLATCPGAWIWGVQFWTPKWRTLQTNV